MAAVIVGDHPVEAGHERLDTQLPHPTEHLPHQFGSGVDLRLRHRAAPPLKVAHQPPGIVGRPRKERGDPLLRIAETTQGILPDGFGPVGHQHEVHAVERHPVQLTFPVFPRVETHRIVERTVVERITVIKVRRHRHRSLGQREVIDRTQVIAHVRHAPSAIVVQVPVYPHRSRIGRGGCDTQFPRIAPQGERLGAGGLLFAQLHPLGEPRHPAFDQLPYPGKIVVAASGRHEQRHAEQPNQSFHKFLFDSKVSLPGPQPRSSLRGGRPGRRMRLRYWSAPLFTTPPAERGSPSMSVSPLNQTERKSPVFRAGECSRRCRSAASGEAFTSIGSTP